MGIDQSFVGGPFCVLTPPPAGPTGAVGPTGPAGISNFDGSVGLGCGGTYATVKDAVDDDKTRIIVLCDTTETADIDPPITTTDLLISVVPDATWDLDTFVLSNSNPCNITLLGGGTLTYAYSSGGTRPFELFDTDTIIVDDLVIDNNSTVDNTPFSFGLEKISNVRFLLPNQDLGGFKTQTALVDNNSPYYENIEFVGGGAACTGAFASADSETGSNLCNIAFTGTFKAATTPPTGSFTDEYVAVFRGCNITNIIFDYSGTSGFYFEVCNVTNIFYGDSAHITGFLVDFNGSVRFSNLSGNDAITGSIFLTSGFNSIYNIELRGTGIFDLANTGSNEIANIFMPVGSIDVSDAGCANNQFTNCRMSDACTIGGDRNKFTNVEFLGGATVVSGANDNGFVNCQFGPDGGAGALTITVNAGSNRTRIAGSMSDAAISDAGTGTVTAANTVY